MAEEKDSLDDILKEIGNEEAAQPAARKRRQPESSDTEDDLKSLKKLRESLLSLGWDRDDVYSISGKFFGRRSAKEINEQRDKLLNSLHYLKFPGENTDLAIKVLSDQMTSAEAIKKSLERKNRAALLAELTVVEWARGFAPQLAERYAGEQTAQELSARFTAILGELPWDNSPQENRVAAIEIMLDASAYDRLFSRLAKDKFSRELSLELPGLSKENADKLTEMFSAKRTAASVAEDVLRIQDGIQAGSFPKDYELAARTALGEVSLEDAMGEVRALKNREDILRVGKDLALPEDVITLLVDKWASPKCKVWFETEFPAVFASIPRSEGSRKSNALLAVEVLAGRRTQAEALAEAGARKNKKDITAIAAEISLSDEEKDALLARYEAKNAPDFTQEYAKASATLSGMDTIYRSAGRLAVRLLLGRMTEEKAVKTAELMQAFAAYALPDEDISAIAERYLGKKPAPELKALFESILEKLPYLNSPEENYGLAVTALLAGTSDAIDSAAEQASIRKNREEMHKKLNAYGWFSGYASDLAERYFPGKDAETLIKEFEDMLAKLPHSAKPKDNYQLAVKVLLGRISFEEANRHAALKVRVGRALWGAHYVETLSEGYLGAKPADALFDFYDQNFSKYKAWAASPQLHKLMAEILVDELNGSVEKSASQLLLELLEAGLPCDKAEILLGLSKSGRFGSIDVPQALEKYKAKAASDKDAAFTEIKSLLELLRQ